MDSLFVKYLMWRETMSNDDPVAVMVRWCAFWTVFLFASWIVYELLMVPHNYGYLYSLQGYQFTAIGWICCIGIGLLSALGLPHFLKAAVLVGGGMWVGMFLNFSFVRNLGSDGYDLIFAVCTGVLVCYFYQIRSRLALW